MCACFSGRDTFEVEKVETFDGTVSLTNRFKVTAQFDDDVSNMNFTEIVLSEAK